MEREYLNAVLNFRDDSEAELSCLGVGGASRKRRKGSLLLVK